MNQKANYILEQLELMYPNAHVELNHKNHFELLVAVVLSAQTTDVSVNKVTPNLFTMFKTPYDMAQAEIIELEKLLKSIGLYHNKAKNIKALAIKLVEEHDGVVPSDRASLEALPGVGRKTANVVLSNAFGIPALAVDTHVERVSVRLGLAKSSDSVLEIEHKLMKKIPKELWQKAHHQLIFFGRYHCLAKKPKCYQCPLFEICSFKEKNLYKIESI